MNRRSRRGWLAAAGVVAVVATAAPAPRAQSVDQDPARPAGNDVSSQAVPRGAEIALPLSSLVVPGLGYDSFHRSLPSLQRRGEYSFLSASDAPAALLSAPVDIHLLARKSTYVPVGVALAIALTGGAAATRW